MSLGGRGRRTVPGFALLLMMALAGCRSVSPTASMPAATAMTATAPKLAGYTPPAEVAPIPVLPSLPATAPAPAPTPLLDAAARRAETIQQALVSEPEAAPPPTPRLAPVAPPDNLILATHQAPAPPPGPTVPTPEPAPIPVLPALTPPPTPAPEPVARPEPADAPVPAAEPEGVIKDEPPAAPAAPPVEAADDAPEPVASAEETPALELLDLRLCRKVRGFGDVDPLDPLALRPGQVVLLYCEVAGLRYEPEGDQFRSRLAAVVEITPDDGGEPIWTRPLGTADDLCRTRRRDYYVNYRFALPDALPAGSYRLRLIQTDALADRAASRTIPFAVRP